MVLLLSSIWEKVNNLNLFPESVQIVLFQTLIQALLALVIMLILRKFHLQYKNDYFQYWSWSWLALIINMVGSGIALANAFTLPLTHPFRIFISIITLCTGLLQILWLFIGSYELSIERKINKTRIWFLVFIILPISIILAFLYFDDPNNGDIRILLRIGIKSFFGGAIFIISSFLLFKRSRTGIGVKFIIFAFLAYGILQFNAFINNLVQVIGGSYYLGIPFYVSGSLDIFLQALMGLGMIISVLEIEQDNLKKANTELDTFLYRSSHDLRAPLTTISGIVQVLKGEKNEEKKQHYLELINERVDQADNVIKDIITLRKGQKLSLNIVEVDLEKEIVSEFDMLKSPIKKAPELQLEIKGDQRIFTDSERLHTVLTNILSNSIKYHNYNQKNPWIRVMSKREEGGILLTIADNGLGIEKRHLNRIFEMFYRANKSSTGSGLGLYLVKDAISVMKGSIEIQSEKDMGTDFTIFLKNLEADLSNDRH